jgi:hypothetical protein
MLLLFVSNPRQYQRPHQHHLYQLLRQYPRHHERKTLYVYVVDNTVRAEMGMDMDMGTAAQIVAQMEMVVVEMRKMVAELVDTIVAIDLLLLKFLACHCYDHASHVEFQFVDLTNLE